VEYDDRLTITTPEGLDLELTLAGVGSRFVSAIVDSAIQAGIIIALVIVGLIAGGAGPVIVSIGAFAVLFSYDVLFEVLNAGRTPGKRWNGLRVVRSSGRPIGFFASAVRNLMRIVDYVFLIGAVAILVTPKNQRLGDLAAGTIVVRELHGGRGEAPAALSAPAVDAYAAWDTSSLTADELAAVLHFLERRDEIEHEPRRRLAHTLAERLRPKIAGAPADLAGERFLEALAAAKRARR
jgi:uncharacterized RDD family membrane protein YckC